jgi:hypothetical protein
MRLIALLTVAVSLVLVGCDKPEEKPAPPNVPSTNSIPAPK